MPNPLNTFLCTSSVCLFLTPLFADSTHIGLRRELFVEDTLIEAISGGARLELHEPTPREIALDHDAAWEGTGSGYHSVFRDGDKYRMYYKAWHIAVQDGKVNTGSHPLFCCYAESDDGITWRKPELGLVAFQGSKANNIVLAPEVIGSVKSDPGHPAVFKDENPACPPEARYKAIIRSEKPHGLLLFQSPDGLRWSLAHPEPIITEGAFDSQNLAFYDPNIDAYRAYWRTFTGGTTNGETWKPEGNRAIRTAVSKDLIHWESPHDLRYVDSPDEQLYTNGVKPYSRAPHLLIGFPARYVERGWSDSMRALPEPEAREDRAKASERYGTALTDGLFMASRDGVTFKRWNEAFLRPGPEREGTWHYGHQYLAWGAVETKGSIEGGPNELSFYATESYWTGQSSLLRRYSLRLDGFVSVAAPLSGGELVTKPIIFSGRELAINFASSAAGDVRVEIQDEGGKPFPGFTLADCPPLFGDAIERGVTWKGGGDVSPLAGKAVRLRFVLRDADLFSYHFREAK
jgi:hypothetical protein